MIRLTLDDGASAIELLGENKAHHLMRKGHLREGKFLVGTSIDIGRESVRTADDEHKPPDCLLFLQKPLGHFHRAQFLSMLVEQDNGVRRLDKPQYLLALALLLLLFRESLRVFQFGDGGYRKRHVVADSAHIILYTSNEMLVHGLACQYEFCLHLLNDK